MTPSALLRLLDEQNAVLLNETKLRGTKFIVQFWSINGRLFVIENLKEAGFQIFLPASSEGIAASVDALMKYIS